MLHIYPRVGYFTCPCSIKLYTGQYNNVIWCENMSNSDVNKSIVSGFKNHNQNSDVLLQQNSIWPMPQLLNKICNELCTKK